LRRRPVSSSFENVTDHERSRDEALVEPYPTFHRRVVRVLAESDGDRSDLELALTDAVARRMFLAANRSRRFVRRDLPAAEEAAELDRLISELRKALDGKGACE
jgi:DNA primase large subunit